MVATLADENETVALPWAVLGAFIRISTNRRMINRPLTLDEALAHVEEWLALPSGSLLLREDDFDTTEKCSPATDECSAEIKERAAGAQEPCSATKEGWLPNHPGIKKPAKEKAGDGENGARAMRQTPTVRRRDGSSRKMFGS